MDKKTAGLTSEIVESCQVCGFSGLEPVLFIGYLPPVNAVHAVGERPGEQTRYPAQILYCPECTLVQLGNIVAPEILFPSEYPYTSSTTRILCENFAGLYRECRQYIKLDENDLVIDIGSNDGNLLGNFKDGHRVLGVTPENIGNIAIAKGIPTIIDYFSRATAEKIASEYGSAQIITATNVFAHIKNINEITGLLVGLLTPEGVFISESHYLLSLLETVQYDTIYHEHLRYYSLQSLKYLLEKHGLEVFHATRIPTHGGSIRVYAGRPGVYEVRDSVIKLLALEKPHVTDLNALRKFKAKVSLAKLELLSLLYDIKKRGASIFGVSAPSRASTLIAHTGIDEDVIDCVLEIKGSHKTGKYVPGTLIPVVDEDVLNEAQPDYLLLFSWHIKSELMPKLRQKGFRGKFIIPLPFPRIEE